MLIFYGTPPPFSTSPMDANMLECQATEDAKQTEAREQLALSPISCCSRWSSRYLRPPLHSPHFTQYSSRPV